MQYRIQSLIKCNEERVVDDEFILKSQMFYNKNILIGGQTIYYEKWFKNDVRFINEIVKNNGEFFSFQRVFGKSKSTNKCSTVRFDNTGH